MVENLEMPTSDVEAVPLVGVFINRDWLGILLSLVSDCEARRTWAEGSEIDRIEQNAFKLYEAILGARVERVHHIGEVFFMIGWTAAPVGAVLMGGNVLASAYPELASIVPPGWVSSGLIHLPSMADRTVFGQGGTNPATGLPTAPGDLVGEKNHTLITSELPSHDHPRTPGGEDIYDHNLVLGTGGSTHSAGTTKYDIGSTTGNRGGDQPHNNMPPGLIGSWFIQAE